MSGGVITLAEARETGLDTTRGHIALFGPSDFIDAVMMGAPEDWQEWIVHHSTDLWECRSYAIQPRFRIHKLGDKWHAAWKWLGLIHTLDVDGTWQQTVDLVRDEYAKQLQAWEEA